MSPTTSSSTRATRCSHRCPAIRLPTGAGPGSARRARDKRQFASLLSASRSPRRTSRRLALALAQANLASAKANLALQQANYDRQKSLPKLATTQQDVDTTAANYQQAKAQVEQARPGHPGDAGSAEYRPVRAAGRPAPGSGRAGQGPAGPSRPQRRVDCRARAPGRLGHPAQRQCRRLPDGGPAGDVARHHRRGSRPTSRRPSWTACGPASRSPSRWTPIPTSTCMAMWTRPARLGLEVLSLPAENATGNFIKIVQRVPVKIVIDSGLKKDEPCPSASASSRRCC